MTEGRYSPTLSPSELELLNPRELEKLDIEYEKLVATRFHFAVSSRTRSLPIRALLLKLCFFLLFPFPAPAIRLQGSYLFMSGPVWAIGLRLSLCLKGSSYLQTVTDLLQNGSLFLIVV